MLSTSIFPNLYGASLLPNCEEKKNTINFCLFFSRLNISATSSDSSTPKKGRGLKRKRVTLDVSESTSAKSGYEYESEAAAKGAIEIHDTDHEGKFIKLFNTGEEVTGIDLY
jgi:hypothetical protein